MRATSCRNKHRRLWRLAVAPHPRTQADWVWAAGSAERDLYNETHCKLRSSAAVGTYAQKMSSLKGDLCFPYIVEDDSRSRFAEPREDEVMLIPQLRSFGACSGFLIDTCPFRTRRQLVFCYGRLRGYLSCVFLCFFRLWFSRGCVKTLLFLKNHKALTFTSQGFAMSKSCCTFRP